MAEPKKKPVARKKKPPAKKRAAPKKKPAPKTASKSTKTSQKKADSLPLPGLKEALGWIGEQVDDSGGRGIGKVSSLFADARDKEPKWLVVRLGMFSGDAAVPFEHIAEGGGRVWTAYTREEVRSSPKLDADQSLNAGQELQLCEHYGIGIGTGRAAQVAEREGDEISAVSAA